MFSAFTKIVLSILCKMTNLAHQNWKPQALSVSDFNLQRSPSGGAQAEHRAGDKPGFTTTSRLRPQFFSYSLVRQGGIFYHFYLSFDSLSISSKRIEAIFRTKYHLELRPLIFLLNILPDLTCCKYMIWNIVIISFFFALSVEFSVWCQFSVVSQLNFCSIVGSLQRSEQDKCSSLVEILLSVRAGWLI